MYPLRVASSDRERPRTGSESAPGTAGMRDAHRRAERRFVDINGVPLGMLIESTSRSNPVLLFVHGGPGMPEYALSLAHPTGLAEDFTVVWWEQRGAGMSYRRDIPAHTMTVAQFIADTIAVAQYLRREYGKDKIFLMGHSWGSFLGIQVAAAAPELFHAYIGMGQVAHQLRSEVMAHAFMLDQFRARHDETMVRRLESAPVDMQHGLSEPYMRLRDRAMHALGIGTTRAMRSIVTGVFIPVLRCGAYTVRERLTLWFGIPFSRRFLWDEILHTDLATRIHALRLPVYFFMGRYDYTANRDLARALLAGITAPRKGFYTFEHSAHSPLFEEPARVRQILQHDVLQERTQLADAE